MCLIADYKVHPHRKAFVTEEDLIVYKKLRFFIGSYYTPFRDVFITFKNGITILESKFSFDAYNRRQFIVQKGIHCYYSTSYGINHLDGYKHYAIIPKGTKYYKDCSEPCLVAHKLIVFKSVNDFRKYCKEHNINSEKYTHGKD